MASTPMARSRAFVALRHALAATGLGLGWLLISSAAASASGDLLGADALLGSPTVSTSSVLEPVTDAVAPATSSAADQGSAVVQGTTTALAGAVETLPSVTEHVLTGPLEPLAPVVSGAASGVGDAITTVGDTLGNTVSTLPPLPDLLPVPVPELTPVVAPLPGVMPGDDAPPAEASTVPRAADAPTSVDPTSTVDLASTARAMLVWGWPVPGSSVTAAVALPSTAGGSPGETPGDTWAFPLLGQPLWLGSGTAGPSGGGLLSLALLSAALLLPPLLLVHARRLPFHGTVPASPAFDPGSTPD
ncbi:hypothetical protein [Sinomonas mesophila]|uniref:hypothetical protein n=1 Tax=Sinomonas mesophila TaxID=1531955 RepID=UPI0011158BB5|nr:hypothetical protein [Sinomonas mesophila]